MPTALVKKLAKKTGKSISDVEDLWDKAKAQAKKAGLSPSNDPDRYYAYATTILKRMIKKESKVDTLTTSPAQIVETMITRKKPTLSPRQVVIVRDPKYKAIAGVPEGEQARGTVVRVSGKTAIVDINGIEVSLPIDDIKTIPMSSAMRALQRQDKKVKFK